MINQSAAIVDTALTLDHICEALAGWTGIPASRLVPGQLSFDDYEKLQAALSNRIFGQELAVGAVVTGLQRRFQLPERQGVRRPVWTALFAGPSGVGKSQLAREVAAHFFGDGNHLIKIDLSELREEHLVARLVGAPPGYRGHGDGGELTNALRGCSSGVLLLDEVEKAHPTILTTVILPLIGEGVVHDMNDGRTLDASHMMIVMTSNLGTNASVDRAVGFSATEDPRKDVSGASVLAAIREYFPREVFGRIDDTIVFSPLTTGAVKQIWQREVKGLEERLCQGGNEWRVRIDSTAEDVLLAQISGAVHREGARAIVRFFDRALVDRCLDLLRHRNHGSGIIEVELSDSTGQSLRYRICDDATPDAAEPGSGTDSETV